jgi:hypothetical protein
LAQSVPARGRGDIYDLTHAGRPQAQKHFGGGGIVLRDERDRRDAGELTDEVAQHFDLLRATPVHRDKHCIDRAFSNDSDGVGDRVAVHYGKTAAASSINPGPFHWQQDCGNSG